MGPKHTYTATVRSIMQTHSIVVMQYMYLVTLVTFVRIFHVMHGRYVMSGAVTLVHCQ